MSAVSHAECAFQTKVFGRFCSDLTERCTPGCRPTSCQERVKALTTAGGSLQLVTFFRGAVNRCSEAGNRSQIFECSWGMAVRQYPDLGSDQCTKDGLFATFDSIAFNHGPQSFTEAQVCDLPRDGSVPRGYFATRAPEHLLDMSGAPPRPGEGFNKPPGHYIGLNEGRLIKSLRDVARVGDPLNCNLVLAAKHFALARTEQELQTAQAFADLSVTGHRAWLGQDVSTGHAAIRGFKVAKPRAAYCRALPRVVAAGCPTFDGPAPSEDALIGGCERALARAYKVANYLRAGQALPEVEKDELRNELGWIAVSGEDDSPHRPVNAPSSAFPQHDIDVVVPAPFAQQPNLKSVRVRSRYVVAQFKAPGIRTSPARSFALAHDWERANASRDPHDPDHLVGKNLDQRAQFFGGWDQPIFKVLIPMAQSDTWQSDHYPCKRSAIVSARLDRHETYDPRFLSWHWRLGGEQLLFSHQTVDPATREPRFKSNTKRMFLTCGVEDNITFNDICGATQRTAPHMTTTPGRALFLDKTGHSVDIERRQFFASQLLAFLDETAPAGPLPISTPLAPPPSNGKKTLGELCLLPAECQSNRCSGVPLRCEEQPQPPQKLSNGQPCFQPSDCQSNRCIITCQAQPPPPPPKKGRGESCFMPAECMSNTCNFWRKCE